jgi:carboxyl-terminal processing protease
LRHQQIYARELFSGLGISCPFRRWVRVANALVVSAQWLTPPHCSIAICVMLRARADSTMWRRTSGLVLLVVAAFAGGAVCTRLAQATDETSSPYAILNQLARVLVLVENEYVDVVDRSRLTEGALKGLVAELDPHSSYMPPRAFETLQADTEGEFGGIGVEVDFRSDEVVVIAALEGSPAERAGIRAGDVIVAIDKLSVRGKSADDLVQRMRGRAGTSVQIGIRRNGEEKIQNFTLERQVITVSSVSSQMLIDGIGYLRIKQFQHGTHAELLEAIARLREGGNPRGVILDLRNNPGGLVREAVAVADELLDSGGIYSTRRREQVVDRSEAHRGGALIEQPMVTLINEYSASAAELVAGALKDNKRATLVGSGTFGKGSVQSIIELPGGAGLRLTTMRYYTPNGTAIQARGVTPDVQVQAAYVEDDSFGVLKERDLENHLPAEGSTNPTTQREPGKLRGSDNAASSETYLGVAKTVPKDPTGGADFALSIGFQILRGVLTQKPH